MSSLEISSYVNRRRVYESNRDSMRIMLNSSCADVISKAGCLHEDFRKELSGDLNNLRKRVDDLVNSYTWEVFDFLNNSRELNDIEGTFSRNALNIKHKIELLKSGQEDTIRRIDNSIKSAHASISKVLSPDMLTTYKNDFENLKKELEKAGNLSSLKQKDKLLEALLETINKLVNVHGFAKTVCVNDSEEEKAKVLTGKDKKQIQLNKIMDEIEKFHGLIKEIDKAAYNKLESLVQGVSSENEQRLKMVKDQIKLTYGKLKDNMAWNSVFKEVLTEYKSRLADYDCPSDILKEIDLLLDKTLIEKAEFNSLSGKIKGLIQEAEEKRNMMQTRREFASKVKENLKKLGYSVVEDNGGNRSIEELSQEKSVYFDTKWEDYKIMTKINSYGEFITRIVKVVSSDQDRQNISSYQKQKDTEIAKHWCGDFDNFLEGMKQDGINLKVNLRKEPEEEPVLYVVNKELAKAKRTTIGKSEHVEKGRYMK